MAKASFAQRVAAFFDPTIAVNEEGNLVNADGFFDNGTGSTDYLDISDIYDSSVRPFFYSAVGLGPLTEDHPGFSSSDTISEPDQVISDLYDKIQSSTQDQNSLAQSSADRAMEFNADQAALYRSWQEAQNQKAMDYSERMANTEIQRRMADLKDAGLNPKLVGSLGGASSPSGVTSSGSAASGSPASISLANLSPLSSLLSTYITSSDTLRGQNNDFVQNLISGIFKLVAAYYIGAG